MSKEFTKIPHIAKYLEDIGVREPIREVIERIHSEIQKLVPATFEDIFINDIINEEGSRVYRDIRFYSNDYYVSAFDFTSKDYFNIFHRSKKISRLKINKIDYDFQKANLRSRMHVTYYINPDNEMMFIDLDATQENCDYLLAILTKYIIPNLYE